MSIGKATIRRNAGVYADADRPPWPRLLRRIAGDIEFLSWLREAPLQDLRTHMQVCGHRLPAWRRVALVRCIARKAPTGSR